jgi:hypothetical protein
MKALALSGSALALAMTIVPSVLVFRGIISWPTHAILMAVGMILWFITAPFWMKKD